jgi:hypothetical protein
MSQIIVPVSGGSLPPAVPTSFVTQDGTAVPAANILIVNAIDSIENNNNGIISKGGVVGTGTSNEVDIVITNRLQGVVTTADATPTSIITFTPTLVGTYTIETRIGAFNSTDTLGAGYSLFGTARFNGVTSTLCGTADRIVNEEVGMETASVTFTVSGANILVNAVGIAAKTINWSAVGLYTYVG